MGGEARGAIWPAWFSPHLGLGLAAAPGVMIPAVLIGLTPPRLILRQGLYASAGLLLAASVWRPLSGRPRRQVALTLALVALLGAALPVVLTRSFSPAALRLDGVALLIAFVVAGLLPGLSVMIWPAVIAVSLPVGLVGWLIDSTYLPLFPMAALLSARWSVRRGENLLAHRVAVALRAGAHADAALGARQLAQACPDSGRPHLQLGLALAAQGDYPGAQRALEAALACRDPGEAAERLACLHGWWGDAEAAAKWAEPGSLVELHLIAARDPAAAVEQGFATLTGDERKVWLLLWGDWTDPRLSELWSGAEPGEQTFRELAWTGDASGGTDDELLASCAKGSGSGELAVTRYLLGALAEKRGDPEAAATHYRECLALPLLPTVSQLYAGLRLAALEGSGPPS